METTSSTESDLQGNALITISKEHVSCELEGETVILHLKDGKYYGLNATAGWIWEYLSEPRTVDQIDEAAFKEFEVDPDRCQREIRSLLQELLSVELITAGTNGRV